MMKIKRLLVMIAAVLSLSLMGCDPAVWASLSPAQQVRVVQELKARSAPPQVRYALSKIGSPYRWGAAGPTRFDCSGLMVYSFKQAGKELPRSSRSIRAVATTVRASDAVPGDLVFRGNPVHHVGMYLGDGLMVHAPQTGDVVKISSVSANSTYGRIS